MKGSRKLQLLRVLSSSVGDVFSLPCKEKVIARFALLTALQVSFHGTSHEKVMSYCFLSQAQKTVR